MAGILACGEARRPIERGGLVPPWLKIMEGLITAKLRAPRDGPAYRSVAAP
jgi:hypothetical protein